MAQPRPKPFAVLARLAAAPRIGDPLERAYTRLRPELREVLALRAGGLEPADIAEILGVADDTAELLVRQARHRLELALATILAGQRVRDNTVVNALGAGTVDKLLVSRVPPATRAKTLVTFLEAAGTESEPASEPLLAPGPDIPVNLPGLTAEAPGLAPVDAADSGLVVTIGQLPERAGSSWSRVRFSPPRVRESLALAACVAAAACTFVLWPSDGDEASTAAHDGGVVPSAAASSRGVSPAGTSRPDPATAPGDATTRTPDSTRPGASSPASPQGTPRCTVTSPAPSQSASPEQPGTKSPSPRKPERKRKPKSTATPTVTPTPTPSPGARTPHC